MGIVISIAEKVGGYLANSITDKIGESVVSRMREHIGYVIDYDSNMKTLKTETDKLGVIQKDVQHSVDEAKKNGQCIVPGVESWLTTANQIIEKVNKLLEDEATVVNKRWMGGLCPDLISRYELSWEAKKKTQDVSGLRAENTWLNYADFESRMSIMEEIMAAQKDDNVNVIGICGLGGVGKTTMVEKVRERAKAEKLFDEIVMTFVTQTPDLKKIQDEIARKLDLKLNEDDDLRERAVSLRNKLMDCKRVLVILDDVWEGLDLKAIGIPVGGVYKGCKVMLTSRSQDACNATGTLRNFTIGVLSEQEAWNLFKEKAGNSVDSPDLNRIAKEVVKECGGLPIAIVTVGSALKGKEERVWKNALGQLKKANPENIPGMEKYVYQSIKMSFQFLDSEAKSVLLLCCLYEEDADISFKTLIGYGMGLSLFKGVDAWAEATDRVYALMDKLKGFYLLLDGSEKEFVKVHDVVRDVIRFIATQGKEIFMYGDGREVKEWLTENTDEEYISLSLISNKARDLPDRLDCPKLELLQLWAATSESLKVPDDLFEGMKELRVLRLDGVTFLTSPTRSLSLLTKLRTLFLVNCKLENVSVIGELKALVILGFKNSSLKELPREIGNLTNLRLLSLTGCGRSLKRISPGVISSLKRLEKLYLRNSGVRWVVEEEGKGENTVNLAELLSLPNLTELETLLPNAKFSRGNNLFANLVRFGIVINDGESGPWSLEDDLRNELVLHLDTMIPADGWINVLLKKTETLRLTFRGAKNVLNDLITPESLIKVKSLKLCNCEGLEYLIDTMNLVLDNIFPNLESLKIDNVDNLKMICHGELPMRSLRELRSLDLNLLPEVMHLWKNPIEVVSLSNLRRVVVKTCDKLENLFSQSIASDLEQLEVLQIKDCKMIEEIVEMEKGEHGKSITNKIRFPKLSELTLVKLPNIIGFCKNMDGIEFPQLSTLCLQNLPEFKSFCPNCLASEGSYDIATQHLFNQKNIEEGYADLALTHLTNLELKSLPKLTHLWKMGTPGIQGFQNLQRLEVEDCQSLKYIFTPSIAKLLVKLEKLWVGNCAIVEIVGKDQEGGEENEEATKVIVFPQLNQLHLKSLPHLINFGAKPYTFEWPVLKELTVDKSSMKVLIPTFQGIGNQKTITVRSHEEVHEQQIIFPSLEVLTLEGEDNVEGILDGQLLTHSSCNLREIHVIKCNQLLAVPWNWLPGLQKLEKLTTGDCASLVEVFEERDAVLLPMLKNLELYNLPKLKHLFNEKLLFPTCLFPNLKLLYVWSCGNLRNLFSPFMTGALVHLEELIIECCEMMEEIVVKGENEEVDKMNKIVIPQLKSLRFYFLPNLKSFCQSRYAFDLPLLEEVRVQNCPKMKAFSLGNLSTPKLQEVKGVWMGDLNNTIQELFERERKKEFHLEVIIRVTQSQHHKTKKLEVNQEIGQEEHLVNESEVNQEIVQEEESEVNQEIEQEEHLVKESEVNQEVGHEEHLDNNDDDHEN